METDEEIVHAIEKAVEEYNQPKELAEQLIKWFEAVASENENIHDRQDTFRRIENLYKTTE